MLDQFLKQFAGNLEQVSAKFGKLPFSEVQSQLQQVAKSTFSKMDLVSREEFEVQAAMLAKYRQRLIEIEARMSELEKALTDKK